VLGAAAYAYGQMAFSWWMFAALFLVPDVFMLGYLRNTSWGAVLYNAGHTSVVPLVILVVAHGFGYSQLLALSLIWIAHIGFDRALGYGLKYASGFTHTHLSWR
jgi:hypothetical protein